MILQKRFSQKDTTRDLHKLEAKFKISNWKDIHQAYLTLGLGRVVCVTCTWSFMSPYL